MRFILCALLALSFGTTVRAEVLPCTGKSSSHILQLIDWTKDMDIVPGLVEMKMYFKNIYPRNLRMIEGYAHFQDKLGARQGMAIFLIDNEVEAGAIFEDLIILADDGHESLSEVVSFDDVSSIVCVTALVESDGTVVRFDD